MILKIYSVRDNVAEAYLQPFFSVNTGSAVRSLTEVVNDPSHQFAKNASDYSLWYLADFDDSVGLITVSADPTRILNLVELQKKND